MGIPKKRQAGSRRGKRRSHDALKAPRISKCPETGLPKLAHRVCEDSGYYGKGKQIFEVEEKL